MPIGRPPLISGDALISLHQRYLNGEPLSVLAEEAGYHRRDALLARFRQVGLRRLRRTNPVPLGDERAQHALALWDTGMSAKEAGARAGLSQTIMTRLLRETDRKGQRIGPDHPRWKGGRFDKNGYVRAYVAPGDPMAAMLGAKSCHVTEHRLVMARHLGRPLEAHETVHHINGDKTDNRIENLQLRVGHHGAGKVMRCADCGSARIVAVRLSDPEGRKYDT